MTTTTATTETAARTRKNAENAQAAEPMDVVAAKFIETADTVQDAAASVKAAAENVSVAATAAQPAETKFSLRRDLGTLAVGGAAGALVGGAIGGTAMHFAVPIDGRSSQKVLAGIAVGAGVGVPVGAGIAALFAGRKGKTEPKK